MPNKHPKFQLDLEHKMQRRSGIVTRLRNTIVVPRGYMSIFLSWLTKIPLGTMPAYPMQASNGSGRNAILNVQNLPQRVIRGSIVACHCPTSLHCPHSIIFHWSCHCHCIWPLFSQQQKTLCCTYGVWKYTTVN